MLSITKRQVWGKAEFVPLRAGVYKPCAAIDRRRDA
jgi:hypothetical protein